MNYGEKILWNLLDGCISRDETFGGCTLEEYANSLKKAFNYFFPDINVRYDTKLNIEGKIVTIKTLKKWKPK